MIRHIMVRGRAGEPGVHARIFQEEMGPVISDRPHGGGTRQARERSPEASYSEFNQIREEVIERCGEISHQLLIEVVSLIIMN